MFSTEEKNCQKVFIESFNITFLFIILSSHTQFKILHIQQKKITKHYQNDITREKFPSL